MSVEKIINDAWENKDKVNENSDKLLKDAINKVIEDLVLEDDSFFKHVSFLKPHPPFHVAEPWFSQIYPENIDLPMTNASLEELSLRHPLLKEFSKKFLNEEHFTEIRFSCKTTAGPGVSINF